MLFAAPCAAEGLTVETAEGETVPLSALTADAPSVLHFWATWCAPCIVELPELAAFMAQHPDLAAGIVPVSIDRSGMARIEGFLENLGVTLRSVRLAEGNAGAAYGLNAYPSTVFLSADGTAERVVTGPLDWTAPETAATVRVHLAGR